VCVCVFSRVSLYLSMPFRLFMSKYPCVCAIAYVQLLLITIFFF
jgi:hypothetical protein